MTEICPSSEAKVSSSRVRRLNDAEFRPQGDYVLYWMVANRRPRWNGSLDRAVELALEYNVPVVVLEALRVGYAWASSRLHRFVMEGMRDNHDCFCDKNITYVPYIEPESGHGAGLLEHMARRACVVVSDDYPCFFIPRMLRAAAEKMPVSLEVVDSNGLFPTRDTDRVFTRAHSFRIHLHKCLYKYWGELPMEEPARAPGLRPGPSVDALLHGTRWSAVAARGWDDRLKGIADLPLDHGVGAGGLEGGFVAAQQRWKKFQSDGLRRYGDDRNHPDDDCSSGLSPYLHFGHISAQQMFFDLVNNSGWNPDDVNRSCQGKREGFWNLGTAEDSFLDELITWRELGFNRCALTDDFDKYESLPEWALTTLREHRDDEREKIYSLEQLRDAATSDDIWNAAQRQLVSEGRMHNYLRMLWGKKILGWTRCAEDALAIMIELNNRFALDGRDPNSYSGIFWVLGRYDRAWGPERPVFGKVRYMTSDSTRKKLRLKQYLARWSGDGQAQLAL